MTLLKFYRVTVMHVFTCELKISPLKEEKVRRLKTTATAMCFLRPIAGYKTDGL